jgi:hypothetical protein
MIDIATIDTNMTDLLQDLHKGMPEILKFTKSSCDHNDLVNSYGIDESQMTMDIFAYQNNYPVLSSF